MAEKSLKDNKIDKENNNNESQNQKPESQS